MFEIDCILEKIKEGVTYPFLQEFLSEPSKRIRSKVAILYLKSANKEISENIFNILATGELIHNASLLHDDVIDEADMRRKKTTVSRSISPKISVLAGDYLISKAMEKVLTINNPQVTEIFRICTQKMCEAEFSQYFSRGIIPTKDDYLKICEGKTATLFSSVLKSCAIISGMDINHAKKFGKIFGIYFQIKNDLNKDSALQDKKNGIYTAIDIIGIEKTQFLLDNYREEMRTLLGVFTDSIYKKELEDLFKE